MELNMSPGSGAVSPGDDGGILLKRQDLGSILAIDKRL